MTILVVRKRVLNQNLPKILKAFPKAERITQQINCQEVLSVRVKILQITP